MRRLAWLLLPLLVALACARAQPPPRTAASVDLARYAGTWYEIGSFPQWFQRGCTATTAHYGLREDGRVSVRNECTRDGERSAVDGVAWPVDESNARLKVRFFWPFAGDYWVLALDPDYRWSLVGTPDRDSLWLLSRTARIDEALYATLVARAEAEGFDTTRLVRTPQPQAD
jgi:apolipoprotein D and lipocalin family protein